MRRDNLQDRGDQTRSVAGGEQRTVGVMEVSNTTLNDGSRMSAMNTVPNVSPRDLNECVRTRFAREEMGRRKRGGEDDSNSDRYRAVKTNDSRMGGVCEAAGEEHVGNILEGMRREEQRTYVEMAV